VGEGDWEIGQDEQDEQDEQDVSYRETIQLGSFLV
jgi:hypothetical protein